MKLVKTNHNLTSLLLALSAMVVVAACTPKHPNTQSPLKPLIRHTQLEYIQARGTLILATRSSAASYYHNHLGATGFDFELAQAFASSLGVQLRVKTTTTDRDLLELVKAGLADFAAGDILASQPQQQLTLSQPFDSTTPYLLYRKGMNKPTSQALNNKVILLPSGSRELGLQDYLSTLYPAADWVVAEKLGAEALLGQLQSGKADYAVVNSNIYDLYKGLLPDIKLGFSLSRPINVSWVLANNGADSSLTDAANAFLTKQLKNDHIATLHEQQRTQQQSQLNYSSSLLFLQRVQQRLPAFTKEFKAAAKAHNLDWRLLAAIAYQESHWNPKATSPTGVKGLMMLTLKTAKELGIENRVDARQSIHGGAAYTRKLLDRLPKEVQGIDRTWLALAAYNTGYGHVSDARKITLKQGDDATNWQHVKQRLPLLTKHPETYKQTRHGYARSGAQSVVYVERINQFYTLLLWASETPQLAANWAALNKSI